MQNISKTYRILAFCGFIALAIATFNNIFIGCDGENFSKSLFHPYSNIVIPLINGSCTILAVIFFIFPQKILFAPVIMIIQAMTEVWTGYVTLGTFIFSFGIVFMFAQGYGRTYLKLKGVIVLCFWIIVLTAVAFENGFLDYLYEVGVYLFAYASYFTIYKLLSDKLNYLIEDISVPDCVPELALPKKGEILHLKELGLSERQISCIHYTVESTWSYKRISEVLKTSESTIKKDMLELYKLFGVKNREMLRLLLFQYKIV